jgi:uncharacterized protein YecE (DUF72 family)
VVAAHPGRSVASTLTAPARPRHRTFVQFGRFASSRAPVTVPRVAGTILVGTSSWADPGFVADWYPEGMPARERLPWYAERFRAVELNSSFYAVPEPKTVERWARATPDGFVFDVKLHRLLSRHSAGVDLLPKDLREEVETGPRGRVVLSPELDRALAERIVEAVASLESAGKLGAFLLQLTPAFAPGRHDLHELDDLVTAFGERRLALELRHRGWVAPKRVENTLSYLSERGLAFVSVDAPPGDHVPIMPPIDAVTRDDLAYLRAHGRNTEGYLTGRSVAERFGWVYSDEELEEIAARARGLAEQAAEVHVMFNNNRGADAPTAASRFRALIGQDPGPPPEDPQLQIA